MIERICCHNVNFEYFDEDENIKITEVPESEIEHVQEMINKDYSQGELCYNNEEVEYRGWWKIQK